MSKLFSSTIREDNIIDYNNMREYLRNNNQSIGDFLIQSYRKEVVKTGLSKTLTK
jgi:hypothetical protein